MKYKRLIAALLLFLAFSEGFAHLTAQPWRADRPADAPSYRFMDGGYTEPEDHDTVLYHIRNGERRTVGTPAHYDHTVWMFGNSGLLGFKVTDDATVPSQLQALLPGWRVVNRSAEAQRIRGELNWLRATPVQPGDVVIFYDGLMDALILDETARPIHPFIRAECDPSKPQHLSLVLDSLFCRFAPQTPIDQRALDEAARQFRQVVYEARHYAAAHGAAFYHFIQPGPLQTYPDTGYALVGDSPVLVAPVETWLDYNGHLNAQGAAIVARQIYDHLTVY